jgi:hypothetical protein
MAISTELKTLPFRDLGVRKQTGHQDPAVTVSRVLIITKYTHQLCQTAKLGSVCEQLGMRVVSGSLGSELLPVE